jgi:NAD(P)H-hydrate epimerase
VLERVEKPVVIDADGLNNLAAEARYALERLQASRGPRVLTPHPGEAARLLDISTQAIQADRPAAAGELARRSGAVVVLKGAGTIVASPENRIAVNSTGNPGMATGGTGDVLTGMIGAYLARGLEPWQAACLGVYLHGLAGDLAAKAAGQESLLASDVVDSLPAALATLLAGTDAAGRRSAP